MSKRRCSYAVGLAATLSIVAASPVSAQHFEPSGEVRLRTDSFDNPLFGLGEAESFTSLQLRAIARGDWRIAYDAQVVVAIGSYFESGRQRQTRPFDQSGWQHRVTGKTDVRFS